MIKPIKFDLKLSNGTKLTTLDDLEENLSPALFEHFHSGKLAKWLRVRKLEELAEKVEALSTEHLADKNELDVKLFKNLCEIFVSEVSEEDAREAVTDYKAIVSTDENSIDSEEIEQLKAELAKKEFEIEHLKNSPRLRKYQINEELLDKLRSQDNTYVKGEIPTFSKKEEQIAFRKKLTDLSIKSEDIIAIVPQFTDPNWHGKLFWCLTHDFLYGYFKQISPSEEFQNPWKDGYVEGKMRLEDIYYVNSVDDANTGGDVVIINHCKVFNDRWFSDTNRRNFIKFLNDYLNLEVEPDSHLHNVQPISDVQSES